MTWVSEQTKKEILDLVIYNGKEYYVNVQDRVVKPIIKHPI